MARMFIRLPSGKAMKRMRNGLKSADLIDIFNVLCGVHDNGEQVSPSTKSKPSSSGGVGYLDFLLHEVGHSMNEKLQVSETLSDNYVSYFFGQRAPQFRFSGSVLNTLQDDWTVRLYRLFQFFGRGTELARNGLVMRIKYDSFIVAGFMTNYNWSLSAANESVCPFSFDFLVKGIQVIGETFSKSTVVPGISTFHEDNLARVGGTSYVTPSTSKVVRLKSSAGTTNTGTVNKKAEDIVKKQQQDAATEVLTKQNEQKSKEEKEAKEAADARAAARAAEEQRNRKTRDEIIQGQVFGPQGQVLQR
jgi:hypothetical protein